VDAGHAQQETVTACGEKKNEVVQHFYSMSHLPCHTSDEEGGWSPSTAQDTGQAFMDIGFKCEGLTTADLALTTIQENREH